LEISRGCHPRNQVKMMHTPAGVVDSSRLSNTPAGVDRLLLQVPGVVPPATFYACPARKNSVPFSLSPLRAPHTFPSR
jgi:hypothetical protein